MIRDNTTESRPSGFRAWDRLLMLSVLVLQVVILWKLIGPGLEKKREESIGTDGVTRKSQVSDAATGHVSSRAGVDSLLEEMMSNSRSHMMAAPLHDHMNRMFAQAITDMERLSRAGHRGEWWDTLATSPSLDMREGPTEYLVLFSLPGLSESDIAVTLDDRLLTILAPASPGAGGVTHVIERRVMLPGPVAGAEQATAVLTNGTLRVTVPRLNQGAGQGEVSGRLM